MNTIRERWLSLIHLVKMMTMNKAQRVRRLKEHLVSIKIKHKDEIMKLSTLKEAHVYCIIHNVSAQQYGPLLEKYIRTKYQYDKNKAEDCTGDCSKDGTNLEIKVSLGGAEHKKFNFVQIRPSHDCGIYILTAYHVSFDNVDEEGELYVFKVPKENLMELIASYGGYAHGTIKEHGEITSDSLTVNKNTKEYALRPTIEDECWKTLMQYRIPEFDL
jgi:hypothetical protein